MNPDRLGGPWAGPRPLLAPESFPGPVLGRSYGPLGPLSAALRPPGAPLGRSWAPGVRPSVLGAFQSAKLDSSRNHVKQRVSSALGRPGSPSGSLGGPHGALLASAGRPKCLGGSETLLDGILGLLAAMGAPGPSQGLPWAALGAALGLLLSPPGGLWAAHCLPCVLMSRAVASCVWSSLVLPPLVIPPRIFSPPVLYPPASPLLVSSWLVLPLVLFPWLQKELLGSLCGSVPSGGLWEASWSFPGGLWGCKNRRKIRGLGAPDPRKPRFGCSFR